MKRFRKEIILFIVLFVVLSLIIHADKWFSAPLEHLSLLVKHPLPYHPFLYTFLIFALIYIIVTIVRVIIKFFKRLATK